MVQNYLKSNMIVQRKTFLGESCILKSVAKIL